MRRIYFVSDQVTNLGVPDLLLSLELWESSYELVMSAAVGKHMRDLWRHHFGAEAEMRLSGTALRRLENGIKKLLSGQVLPTELGEFLRHLSKAAIDARAKGYHMIVIAD